MILVSDGYAIVIYLVSFFSPDMIGQTLKSAAVGVPDTFFVTF